MRGVAPSTPVMARGVTVPMWGMVLFAALSLLGISYIWYRGNSLHEVQEQMRQLELRSQQLSLELEAQKARNETYGVETVEVQQNLKLLESELNRLRAKVKLPPVKLVPTSPASQPPKAEPTKPGPKGAGEPVDPGDLLLSLRSQMGNFSAELEYTANTIYNPLPSEPVRIARAQQIEVQKPNLKLSDLKPLPALPKLPEVASNTIPSGVPLSIATQITSTFGYRSNPFSGNNYEFHNGLDFAAPMGAGVHATAAGTVSELGWNRIFGLMVMIDHGNGYYTLFGHLSATYVHKGQKVQEGTLLGAVGSTGRSTGPHLHYTVFRYGSAVDPSPFVGLN